MIRPIIYLVHEVSNSSGSPLDHTKKLVATKYYGARVTELNGAQEQIDVFGQQFTKSWVIRFDSPEKADYVGFEGEFNEKTQSPKYSVNQIRNHRNRTTMYVTGTVVKP